MADLRSFQPSFTAGELSPALGARVDLAKYGSGLATAINLFIHPHGGVSNRAGLEFINEVKDSADITRLVPFQFNTEQSYILEFGDLYVRVYKDGGLVLSSTTRTITGVTQASPGVVTSAAHGYTNGDEIVIDGIVGMTQLDGHYLVAGAAANTFTLTTLAGVAVNTSAYTAYSSGGTANAVYQFTSPYASANLATLSWIQEADVMYFTHTSFAPRKLARTADDAWTMSTPTFAPSIAAPTGQSAVRTVGAAGADVSYKVSAIADETAEESLPSGVATISCDLSIAGNKNTVSWSAVTGAVRYVVYKLDNGVYGYIGGTEGLSFVDENITADVADTPQVARNPFTGADNYPRCASFVDQRLAFASSINDPQAVWTSQTANYENFGSASPAKESDAITFRIRARQVNEIRSMLPMRGLMVLTSGAEWIVQGASTDYLTQNVAIRNQGYRGAAVVQPIVVGNTVLFAQERGGVVRDFSYEFAEDGFTGKDLTILARHLFQGKSIKAWAYSQAPYSIVWVVLNDGTLVSLTYMKEHEVWGWTQHETDGTFEDVTVVDEGDEDVPYFVVNRTIGAATKRFIEKLHTREFATISAAFFVDSGLSHDGAPISTISLPHLAGETVVALVDGNVVTGLTVGATGTVTLPNAGSVIHCGLAYEASLETLDLDLGSVQGLGTVQGRKLSVSEVTLRVENTRGIWIGPKDGTRTDDWLVEYKQRSTEAWSDAIGAYTGDLKITPMWDWTDGGTTWIKQFDPLPMTILAIMPDITIGR